MLDILNEKGSIKTNWTIRKYILDKGESYKNAIPYERVDIQGNLLLNEGITALMNLLIGSAETAYNNANTFLGVGDSTVAAVASQTALQAATNKLYQPMEATYPLGSSQTLTFRSVFGSTQANFNWREFSVANGDDLSTAGVADNLNRKVSNQGSKVNGQVWTLDLSLTFS